MEQENRSFRTGVIVLVTALVCRLLSAYLPAIPIQQEVASVLLFLETGRVIKYSYTPAETQPLTPQPLVFSPEDSALVQVSDREKYGVDVQAMLSRELSWDLTAEKPTVLILHSHATESYAETQSNGYHSTKAQENMLSIGACLAEILEESGISCIHDTTLHDKPSYNGAYTSSRTSIDDYLSRYPSIRLVLDLHRDSAVDAGGNRYAATVDTVYGESAKLMLVMATNASGVVTPRGRTT